MARTPWILRCLAVLLAVVASTAMAQEKTLRIATQNPKGHPIALGLERFAELVEARSRGRIKVLVFPGGTLGADEVSIAALQAGTLEMASLNSGILSNQVGAFAVFDLPLLFSGDGEADAILDSPFGRAMHASLQAKGLVGLAYYELGFRQITNNLRPINTVADIEGLSLRVIPTRLNIDWVRALRAQAVPIPFPDVYAALESKAVDGQDNPSPSSRPTASTASRNTCCSAGTNTTRSRCSSARRSGTGSMPRTSRCCRRRPASRPSSSAPRRGASRVRRSRASGSAAWSSPGCPTARHARWPSACAR